MVGIDRRLRHAGRCSALGCVYVFHVSRATTTSRPMICRLRCASALMKCQPVSVGTADVSPSAVANRSTGIDRWLCNHEGEARLRSLGQIFYGELDDRRPKRAFATRTHAASTSCRREQLRSPLPMRCPCSYQSGKERRLRRPGCRQPHRWLHPWLSTPRSAGRS